ncbi:DUF1905 domain-containing protein [Jannaschia sp. R86511]|uniref:DUF1905 domain-containing protein n=1 Tax=Jannaschia sp. R86511 TaxID=3093853 RepID=UPI0036D2144A
MPEQGSHEAVDHLTGELERLPGVGGWYVLRLGPARSQQLRAGARRGFVPVAARVGGSAWDTSLMPMGDGTLFLALPAHVRRAEAVDEGDQVRAVLRPRERPPAPRRGRW